MAVILEKYQSIRRNILKTNLDGDLIIQQVAFDWMLRDDCKSDTKSFSSSVIINFHGESFTIVDLINCYEKIR